MSQLINLGPLWGPWPEIVQFRTADGVIRDIPPLDGRGFKLVIHNLPAYEELARPGRLYRLAEQRELYDKTEWAAQPWRVVLGFAPDANISVDDAEKAFRLQAFQHHPDRGGTVEKMLELNLAREAALCDLRMQD